MDELPAPLVAALLCGGRGRRLGGCDKGRLRIHQQEQRELLHQLLQQVCSRVICSLNAQQVQDRWYQQQEYVVDFYQDCGPMGALASLHRYLPGHAWLVLAVDMPQIGRTQLEQLLSGRQPQQDATVFQSTDGQLQPLCAVYEPRLLQRLAQCVAQGQLALTPLLRQSQLALLTSEDTSFFNINYPQDLALLRQDGPAMEP